jgi:hypothetical protein
VLVQWIANDGMHLKMPCVQPKMYQHQYVGVIVQRTGDIDRHYDWCREKCINIMVM